MDLTLWGGCYRFQRSALGELYRNLDASRFGTVTITGPEGEKYIVRDFHYPLVTGHLGMLLVPVDDDAPVPLPNGHSAAGSALVDELLRARTGLDSDDPVFALACYIRPEEHALTWRELLSSAKLFYGYKHIGAYLGEGKTTHAPEAYHPHSWNTRGHNVWNVRGCPATLFTVALQGEQQATITRNARIADAILNKNVLTLRSFERMKCRVTTLNTAFQFYRDWIREAEYLTDISWYLSCGDHKALVINIMLNLPHNPKAFADVYGSDGESLWSDFTHRFSAIFGREFQPADETTFEPLWKKEGLTEEEVRPLSLAQQNAFDAAIADDRLDSFEGVRPLPPGVGMVWPMETTLDLMTGFSSTYLNVANARPVTAAAAVLGLTTEASKRLGIVESQFRKLVAPLISNLLVEGTRQSAKPRQAWLVEAKAEFRRILAAALSAAGPDPWAYCHASAVAEESFALVEQQLPERSVDHPADRSPANDLPTESEAGVQDSRRERTKVASATNRFATPGILHRIALGAHPCSKFVTVNAICTVIDQSEVEYIGTAPGELSPGARRASPAEKLLDDHGLGSALEQPGDFRQPDLPRSEGQSKHRIATLLKSSTSKGRASEDGRQLAYVLGRLGFDFGSEAGLDAFRQRMRRISATDTCPQDERQLFRFLTADTSTERWDTALVWTLGSSTMPHYAIRAVGPFERESHERLLQLFGQQVSGQANWVVVPGTVAGNVMLLNGNRVPVLIPELRGMNCGTTEALLRPGQQVSSTRVNAMAFANTLQNLLDRAYHELQNVGLAPQDRALNFAATKVFEYDWLRECLDAGKALDQVRIERSKVWRPDGDCWDVIISFFEPGKPRQLLRQFVRITVDVSDVLPVPVGHAQSWIARH